ncbi:hypothetical protein AYI69_g9440 [Smittium culicis]|uniref:Uncharacterized protein n=1 Tax=Smittium culicis TaxID=133412 RepID=A0A1R1XCK0_9FUNG|nr:hypothetical protein AYI69_g9440 [Smittium culicis]
MEIKLKQIDAHLAAREEALEIKQRQMEEQITAIQQANNQHAELIEAMNGMRLEVQTVVAELETIRKKNKTLVQEKRTLEKELESVNSQNILASGSLKIEQKKILTMNELMEKQNEFINSSTTKRSSNSSRTGKEIPVPQFEGNPLEYRRWISNVDDYFQQYKYISDFEKKYIVVSALDKKAKDWYNSANDSEVGTWEALYYNLKKEYRNECTYIEAISIMKSVKLTRKTKYSDFINKIRPAVQIMSNGNSEFAIPLMLDCIDKDIKVFLPILPNETIIMFENRLMEQHRALRMGINSNSGLNASANSLENNKDPDGDWIMAVNSIKDNKMMTEEEKIEEIEAVIAIQKRLGGYDRAYKHQYQNSQQNFKRNNYNRSQWSCNFKGGQKCTVCGRNNHSTSNCFFNKPKTLSPIHHNNCCSGKDQTQ